MKPEDARAIKMKILFALVLLTCLSASAADVRIVNNARVDLQPIHDWLETKTGDRPMAHWKQIEIHDVIGGGPWPVCKLTADGLSKTVYLKNVPPSAAQYWIKLHDLTAREKNLRDKIANDTKRLRSADMVDADVDSDYYRNRETFRVNLQNSRDDLDALQSQLAQLHSQQKELTSDFAMFTGQVYNKLEVWDCGLKQ